MKSLLIVLGVAAILAACSKQAPDWDQTECLRVWYWQQDFIDSTLKVSISDSSLITGWPKDGRVLCGDELAKDLKNYPKGETLCDVDGTKYWHRVFITTQTE